MVAINRHTTGRDFLTALALAVVAAGLYAPVRAFEFIGLDDRLFVADRPEVLGGLTGDNVRWAFGYFDFPYYIPLTWLSYQFDATVSGAGAAGFHTTNWLLHGLNSALAYLVFRRLGGRPDLAAAAVLLWLAHPQRAESVAWVSERKGLLSVLFGLLAVAAYLRFAEQKSVRWLAATTGLMAASLAAKPALLTLPFALLLLDYWPLHRLTDRRAVRRAVIEKWPLFVLAVGWGAAAYVTQVRAGAATSLGDLPPVDRRAGDALVNYAIHLRQALWPSDLAPIYPREPRPGAAIALALGVLLVVTAGAIAVRRSAPAVLVGWLWFVGNLAPVIGFFVTFGPHAYADRNTYWPHLGLAAAVVWGGRAALARIGAPGWAGAGAVGLLAVAAAVATREQLSVWENDFRLWSHTVAVTGPNPLASGLLANDLYARGDSVAALAAADAALAVEPQLYIALLPRARALYQLRRMDEADAAAAAVLSTIRFETQTRHLIDCLMIRGHVAQMAGRTADAIDFFGRAAALAEDFWEPDFYLGTLLAQSGRPADAIGHLEAARAKTQGPPEPRVLINLGLAHLNSGSPAGAVAPLTAALAADRHDNQTRAKLAMALVGAGRSAEAAQHVHQLMRSDPGWLPATSAAAWRMATDPDPARRRGGTALQLAQLVCLSAPEPLPEWLDVLAAATAETGDFVGAVRISEAAAQRADRVGNRTLADAIRARTEGYRNRKPYRAAPRSSPSD